MCTSMDLAEMAAAWDVTAIDRCIIQAHYVQAGYAQEDEMAWLLIPADWPQGEVQQLPAPCPDGAPGPMQEVKGGIIGEIKAALESANAARENAHDLGGERSPRGAHTPTELYTDAEDSGGVLYSNEGDGGTGITSPGMGMQRGQAPTNVHARPRPAVWSGANGGRGSSNAVEYGENACMAPANAGAANLAVVAGEEERSGAPHLCNGDIVLHPGAIAFNAAIWEQLGDPYDAFALGGG